MRKIKDYVQIIREDVIYQNCCYNGVTYLNSQDLPLELLNQNIAHLSVNTKSVTENDIFICIKGYAVDGHDMAQEAIRKGAIALVVERELPLDHIFQIVVEDSRKAMAILAKYEYQAPADSFKLIGITGTNGKTTTAWLVMQILIAKGYKTGMIGTIGYYINGVQYESERTTPDVMELNQIFCQMRDAGVEYVVMEVSSHAIALSRVYGLKFETTAFTNLSQDHLDFHKDMQDYANTKLKLFTDLQDRKGNAVINIDDAFGKEIIREAVGSIKTLSLNNHNRGVYPNLYLAQDICFDIQKSAFTLSIDKLEKRFETSLIGDYNIQNCITAIAITDDIEDKSGIGIEEIIRTIKPAKGRIESVQNHQGIGIYIDYAHTPDAVENVLKNLSRCKPQPNKHIERKSRIITLLGAGGNRDKMKRPLMTKAALKYSDLLILCDDNPRDEVPSEIILDMLSGIETTDQILILRDRKKAIHQALKLAKKGDIVLIAGKGHETYQEINGVKYPFNECDIVNEFLTMPDFDEHDDEKLSIEVDIMNFNLWFSQEFNTESLKTFKSIDFISTDSRKVKENTLFIALKGEKFDGADYCESVLKNESVFCLINQNYAKADELKKQYHDRIICAADTQKAYGFIAGKFLTYYGIIKIALTGSTGKTTTKEFLYNILSEKYQVLTNSGNENNLIGVPKTILNINPSHEIAVLECGTNQFGEIRQLAEIVKPDISLIINIGPSHLEFLENEEGVFREKSVLFDYTKEVIIFPENDSKFDRFKHDNQSRDYEKLSIGESASSDFNIHSILEGQDKIEFKLNEESYQINDNVRFKVTNASFAIVAAKQLGLSAHEIQNGLLKSLNVSYRMKKMEMNGSLWLVDCYNANPVSMKSAIHYWMKLNPQKKHYAVLGDMLELGKLSEKYHQEIHEILVGYNIVESVFSVGQMSRFYGSHHHFEGVDELVGSKMLDQIPSDSVVLIKASHGIHLERLIER